MIKIILISGVHCWTSVVSPLFSYDIDTLESIAFPEYLACGIKFKSSVWTGTFGFDEAQLVYCHEYNWATTYTDDFKGKALSGELIGCPKNSYIKGVKAK
jgi:hypothetical protein